MESKNKFILFSVLAFFIIIVLTLQFNNEMHPLLIFEEKERPTTKLTVVPHLGSYVDICIPWQPNLNLYPSHDQISENGASAPDFALSSLSKVTSTSNSKIEIINPQDSYRLCDVIVVRIVVKNDNGDMKSYGGDYFRSKIFTTRPYSASGPDYYFDYHNGTYVLIFTLRWTGVVNVDVMLVHPSEAVAILKRSSVAGNGGNLFAFYGIFESVQNGFKHREDVTCGVSDFQTPSCNVSAVDTHGPWFCKLPKDSHLTCNNWTYHFMDTKQSLKNLDNFLTSVEKEIFKRTKISMKTSIKAFQVRSLNTDRPELSFCGRHNVPTTIKTSGYFRHNKWQRFDCELKSFEPSDIDICLAGKTLHLYGDSTARQMYTYLKETLNCTNSIGYCCSIRNTTIHFKFHGLPVRGKSVVPAKNMRYLAEEIDELHGGPEVVILLSVWAHFGMTQGSFYRQRLLAIKGAIERLWVRSPETTVIIRSANTREHSIGGFILVSSDWIALQGEATLRSVFGNDNRFMFIDVWDMTLVQNSMDQIHPLNPTLEQIMNYMLTLICPE